MSYDEQRKADMDFVQKHVTALGERFDSVQVFVTRHEAGEHDGTVNINLGAGNYFTRYGQIRDWCIRQDEQARIDRRADSADK